MTNWYNVTLELVRYSQGMQPAYVVLQVLTGVIAMISKQSPDRAGAATVRTAGLQLAARFARHFQTKHSNKEIDAALI